MSTFWFIAMFACAAMNNWVAAALCFVFWLCAGERKPT